MLLGQLFYYQKTLQEVKQNLTPDRVSGIEILGLDNLDSNKFAGMGRHEIARILKDSFSVSYAKILKKEKLLFAESFWQSLTSPLKSSELSVKPGTEYQKMLAEWLEKEASFKGFDELLYVGFMSIENEDYACYYGLSVLNELTVSDSGESDALLDEDENDLKEGSSSDSILSDKSQILVLCSTYLAPLFVNLNAEFLPVATESEVNLAKTQEKIKENPEVKLVLLVGEDMRETEELLSKKLPENVMVSTLALGDSGDAVDTYFDDLVKNTLGIRLA